MELPTTPLRSNGQRWHVTSYQAIVQVLHHERLLASPPGVATLATEEIASPSCILAHQLLFFPPHTHVQAARIIRQALLAQQRAASTRHIISEAVTRLLDRAVQRGMMDVVSDFARPLSSQVAAHLLGLPTDNEAQLCSWAACSDLFADYTSGYLQESSEPMVQFHQDLLAFVARARKTWSGPTTVVGALLAAPQVFPSDHVIASNLQMMHAAGRVTVEKTLAEGLHVLACHPDLWYAVRASWREDTQTIARMIEEWLRFITPTRCLKRWARHDLDGAQIGLPGTTIARGQELLLSLVAANHDPALFAYPWMCRPDRRPNPHLAFGAGVHLCPGAGLARMELSIALEQVLTRLETMTPHEQTGETSSHNPNLGGLRRFCVRVHAAHH